VFFNLCWLKRQMAESNALLAYDQGIAGLEACCAGEVVALSYIIGHPAG
jgi:hypothetical protein